MDPAPPPTPRARPPGPDTCSPPWAPSSPRAQRGGTPLPGLVRAPRALLVVDRGFALVVVAEVWAAAAAAASVARFCNCRAFMPVEGRETPRQQEACWAVLQTRGQMTRAGAPGSRPCDGTLCPAASGTRAPPRFPAEPPTVCPAACPHPGRVPIAHARGRSNQRER